MEEADVQWAKRYPLGEHKRDPCRALAPTSLASGFTSPRRAHQPRPDPHNPAPPRREACESRSASLFSPEPPERRHKTKSFCAGLFAWSFAKTTGALAALARPPLVAEPILSGARLLAAPLSGIGVRIPRAREAILSWAGVIRLLCPSIALVY